MEKHPKSLWVLSINQTFFCFALGSISALLTLYLINKVNLNTNYVYEVFAAFNSLLFTLPLVGGYIGEQVGYNKSIFFGLVFSLIGILILTFGNLKFIYFGISCFLAGSSLVIPNINALIGLQYSKNSKLRYSAYTLYYLIYNGGFLTSAILSGFFSNISYSTAFGISIFILIISILIFSMYLKISKLSDQALIDKNFRTKFTSFSVLTLTTFGLISISLYLLTHITIDHILLWSLTIIASLGLIWTSRKKQTTERFKILAFLLLAIISIAFQALYLLEPSLLTVFISQNVNRQFFNITIPASSYYALDPFFVILLGLFFSKLWKILAYKNKDLPLPIKFSSSLVIMGIGYLIFCIGILNANHITNIVSSHWIILGYAFLATGELLIAPIGLAMVGLLLPKGREGLGMGIWQLYIGFSAIISSYIANMANTPQTGTPESTNPIFMAVLLKAGLGSVVIGIVSFSLAPVIKKLCNDNS